MSKKFTSCKKRRIGGQLQVDAVYRLKEFGKISLFDPANFEFAHNRHHINRITDFRAPWNKAWKEAGLGCGYKLNAKYVEKGWVPSPTIFKKSPIGIVVMTLTV